MAWIKVIEEDEAEGDLKLMYETLRDPRGSVENILKAHSLNPASLRANFELYQSIMHEGSEFSHKEREMVAVVVASTNRCHY